MSPLPPDPAGGTQIQASPSVVSSPGAWEWQKVAGLREGKIRGQGSAFGDWSKPQVFLRL